MNDLRFTTDLLQLSLHRLVLHPRQYLCPNYKQASCTTAEGCIMLEVALACLGMIVINWQVSGSQRPRRVTQSTHKCLVSVKLLHIISRIFMNDLRFTTDWLQLSLHRKQRAFHLQQTPCVTLLPMQGATLFSSREAGWERAIWNRRLSMFNTYSTVCQAERPTILLLEFTF